MKRYFHDIIIAVESILTNKLKSVLTALGIIFGVAAVISMLAIGKGAQQEIMEQIKMVGVNNIVINPIVREENKANGNGEEGEGGEKQQSKFSRGLTILDVEAIDQIIPSINRISPEIAQNAYVLYEGKRLPAKMIGVSNDYFELYNLRLIKGSYFNDYQGEHGIQVCIIGANIAAKFFRTVDPINQYMKFGNVWLKVIGVLEKGAFSLTAFENTGVNVYNDNIYIPVKTMLMRFQNRALINSKTINTANRMSQYSSWMVRSGMPQFNTESNYNQLDRIIAQVQETEQIVPTTEVLSRMILRRHSEVKDFEIIVPELLLKQQQRTKDIFNIVLGAIASISLVVGGIGIMNIMFASVMERIKEIGTRMAIGAKKMDIVVQFLSEAILISVTGGFIGVVLGIIISKLIDQITGILTIVTPFSVFLAFGVSAAVGIVFGYSPAKRAAEKDPIESLRYE